MRERDFDDCSSDWGTTLILARDTGDLELFSRFFESAYGSVYQHIFRYVSCPHTADDLASETLSRVFEELPKCSANNPHQARRWVKTIAHSIFVDWWRRKKRELVYQDSRQPHDGVEKFEQIDQLRHLLACLSDEERELVELFYFENLTLRKISGLVGKSVNAVGAKIDRARKKMRKMADE